MAREKESGQREVEVQVPAGVELSDEELRQIEKDIQGDTVDVVSSTRAAALKVVVVPKAEEVMPKTVMVPKVKQ